jgi:hypothetical protein
MQFDDRAGKLCPCLDLLVPDLDNPGIPQVRDRIVSGNDKVLCVGKKDGGAKGAAQAYVRRHQDIGEHAQRIGSHEKSRHDDEQTMPEDSLALQHKGSASGAPQQGVKGTPPPAER